jgi:uncharacterized protein (DUF1697 family)
MNTYISILRGINVSGKNLIKIDSLKEIYEDLGFQKVQTYIQSGNVVFQSDESRIEELERKIYEAILKQFILNVPVLVREASELKEILDRNPFLPLFKEDISKLHITFLSAYPEKHLVSGIENGSYLPDKYFLLQRCIYLFCPNGYGRTKLSNNFFENKLKVKATTRNLKTLMQLVKLAQAG